MLSLQAEERRAVDGVKVHTGPSLMVVLALMAAPTSPLPPAPCPCPYVTLPPSPHPRGSRADKGLLGQVETIGTFKAEIENRNLKSK